MKTILSGWFFFVLFFGNLFGQDVSISADDINDDDIVRFEKIQNSFISSRDLILRSCRLEWHPINVILDEEQKLSLKLFAANTSVSVEVLSEEEGVRKEPKIVFDKRTDGFDVFERYVLEVPISYIRENEKSVIFEHMALRTFILIAFKKDKGLHGEITKDDEKRAERVIYFLVGEGKYIQFVKAIQISRKDKKYPSAFVSSWFKKISLPFGKRISWE
jgi:hypothetical protein